MDFKSGDEHGHVPTLMLYSATTISACDGLSNKEIDRFKQVCKAMGVSDSKIDEKFQTVMLEYQFTKKINQLRGIDRDNINAKEPHENDQLPDV